MAPAPGDDERAAGPAAQDAGSGSRLDGKVVVVTGASGGQGQAEAALLAAAGATVVATDVDPRGADAPPGVTVRRLDVSDPADWVGLASWLRSEHGAVHGLVNNAGISIRARLDEVSLEDWNRVLAVNLTGAMLGIQALTPLMTSGGSIVNVGSTAASTAHYPVAYTASKWGLRGLTHVASLELSPHGIRVNIIHPGFIVTPMLETAPQAFIEAAMDITPIGRPGLPRDVAPLVRFLLSDDSSFITGAEIAVDGGSTSHGGAKVISDASRALSQPDSAPAP